MTGVYWAKHLEKEKTRGDARDKEALPLRMQIQLTWACVSLHWRICSCGFLQRGIYQTLYMSRRSATADEDINACEDNGVRPAYRAQTICSLCRSLSIPRSLQLFIVIISIYSWVIGQ
jgi:hypothetical protein